MVTERHKKGSICPKCRKGKLRDYAWNRSEAESGMETRVYCPKCMRVFKKFYGKKDF